MRFTERAYTAYTEEAVRSSANEAVRLTFSNSNFDPKIGARQYNEYLDEDLKKSFQRARTASWPWNLVPSGGGHDRRLHRGHADATAGRDQVRGARRGPGSVAGFLPAFV